MMKILGAACATWAIVFPLAIAAVIYGADALIWVLELLS